MAAASTSLRSHIIFLVAVNVFFLLPLTAQVRDADDTPDTVATDLLDTTDVVSSDSPRTPVIPIRNIGTIDRGLTSDNIIDTTTSLWNEYRSLNDILTLRLGIFILDLGSVGQYSGLTSGGVDGRSVALLHDGVPLNEPITGLFSGDWYQTEFFERIEVERGVRAFLYGFNATGGVINMQSRNYRAIRPRSRIRYSESIYEQTFFDGMFSQNLTRNLNVTAGVQRYAFDGRFRNSGYDAWNARVKTLFNVSDKFNIFFSELYTKNQIGLFGGIDESKTDPALRYDRIQATIVNGDSYEKNTRHDLQLGAAALLFEDTTAVTNLTMYYSTQLREFRNEENRPNPDGIFIQDDHRTRWYGARAAQHIAFGLQTLMLGGEIQSRQVRRSPRVGRRSHTASSVFGKLEVQPTEILRAAGYARLENYLGHTTTSYGANVAFSLTEVITLFGGHSRSVRFPTFEELYWHSPSVSGPLAELDPEQHRLFEVGGHVNITERFTLDLRYFHRVIRNAIVTERAMGDIPFPNLRFAARDRVTINGVEINSSLHVGKFLAEGMAHYLAFEEDGVAARRLPRWNAVGGVYFLSKLFDEALDLKIGIRGRVIGSFDGVEFNPEAMMFIPNSGPALASAATMDGVLIAKIGTAYVHFIWQNVLDRQYIITSFYPMTDRALRFGLTWEFLD